MDSPLDSLSDPSAQRKESEPEILARARRGEEALVEEEIVVTSLSPLGAKEDTEGMDGRDREEWLLFDLDTRPEEAFLEDLL